MQANRSKAIMLVILEFYLQSTYCAQPNAANNVQHAQEPDRCTRICNRVCETYGRPCLLLMAIGALCYVGSSYINPVGDSSNHGNSTAIIPLQDKSYSPQKSFETNLSAQRALFNLRKSRFRLNKHNKNGRSTR